MYTNSHVAAAEQSKPHLQGRRPHRQGQRPHRQGRRPDRNDERGLAMVYALLGILLLSMLAAALMLVSSTEAYASFNYKTQTQGSFAARAGVERAVDWFLRIYGPQLNPNLANSNILAGTYDLTSDANHLPLYPTGGGAAVVMGTSANFPTAAQFGGLDAVADFDGIRSGTVNLGNATAGYRVDTAELLSHDRYKGVDRTSDVVLERWRITVTGLVQGALADTVVQDTAVIRTGKIPLFRDAIRGACEVQINGTLTTNSYDGSTGAYNTPPGTNINTGQYGGASVASNSFVGSSGGSGVINGQLYYGTSANPCPPGETVNDGMIAYPPPIAAPGVPYPPIPPFTVGTGKKDCTAGSAFDIGPYILAMTGDTYSPTYMMDNNAGTPQGNTMGDCDLSGSELVMLRVPTGETAANFYLNNIRSVGGSGLIMVHDSPPYLPCQRTDVPRCAPVILNVADTFDLGGGGLIASTPGDATRFTVNIAKPSGCPGGATCCPSAANCGNYSGNTDFYGTIYAPNCSVDVGGNGDLFGAVTACNVTTQGGAQVHFDLQLRDLYVMVTPFRVVNQSRRVF